MGQQGRLAVWFLLVTTSLAWLGCKQLSPRQADQPAAFVEEATSGETVPSLEIPNPGLPQSKPGQITNAGPSQPPQIASNTPIAQDPPPQSAGTPPSLPPPTANKKLPGLEAPTQIQGTPPSLPPPTPDSKPAPKELPKPSTVASSQPPQVVNSKAPTPQSPATLVSRPSLLGPVPLTAPLLPQASPAAGPNPAVVQIRTLYQLAVERYANTPAYIARLRRRELVDGKQRPEELILFKYRMDPASIYMRWLGGTAKNREVLYVEGQYDDMVHVWPAANDPSGLKANGRSPLQRPDSAEGLGKERYPVRQTGVGPLLARFGKLLEAVERGDQRIGSLKYLGPVKRPEFEAPVDAVIHLIPAGFDPTMPKGGQRLWYFDNLLRFPVLVIAQDIQGHETEYYGFDRFLFPGRIEDDEFNPAKLGRR